MGARQQQRRLHTRSRSPRLRERSRSPPGRRLRDSSSSASPVLRRSRERSPLPQVSASVTHTLLP